MSEEGVVKVKGFYLRVTLLLTLWYFVDLGRVGMSPLNWGLLEEGLGELDVVLPGLA